ncbi:MAG TPA: ATP synthase F1 subunit delta [Candidatus Acidoferrales bacterium]|nr:ATP synthase F1 subunit delta [Candidatus Acidoferrales bacterium]
MKDASVAGRYARALQLLVEYEARRGRLAHAQMIEQLDRTQADLDSLAELVAPGTRLEQLLSHPKIAPADKRELLRRGLDGRAVRAIVVFADLLLRKKRLAIVGDIARDFAALVERAKGLQHARVVSAIAFGAAELERVRAGLQRWTGGPIVLSNEVDPSLIGGAYARVGDRILDLSVRSQLETIADQLYELRV